MRHGGKMADRVRHDATMTVVMLAFYVIAQVYDLFASDIETCLHVSASLGFFVIARTRKGTRQSSLDFFCCCYLKF
jgi:hypothetical protein